MGFMRKLTSYAKDAANAKIDEAKSAATAKAREAIGSTSAGAAALNFVDKVNAHAEAGELRIDGTDRQNVYIYVPDGLLGLSEGDRVWLEVRAHGDPMVSVSTGSTWSEESSPGTFPVFHDGVQVGMVPGMHGFYEHALRDGLKVFVSATYCGMYDATIPDFALNGWGYSDWVEFFDNR